MNAELAVVELGAVAQVGAGDEQFGIGHAALHVEHSGPITVQIKRAGIEKAHGTSPGLIPEALPGVLHKGGPELVSHDGAAFGPGNIDHHARLKVWA